MGSSASSSALVLSFEDVQYARQHLADHVLIHTLPIGEQHCLIAGTVSAQQEERVINRLLDNRAWQMPILVYGRNASDETAPTKCRQLLALGFQNVYLYRGGLFEWLLLQDIYGGDENKDDGDGDGLFPTVGREMDLLRYKPARMLPPGAGASASALYLTNGDRAYCPVQPREI